MAPNLIENKKMVIRTSNGEIFYDCFGVLTNRSALFPFTFFENDLPLVDFLPFQSSVGFTFSKHQYEKVLVGSMIRSARTDILDLRKIILSSLL